MLIEASGVSEPSQIAPLFDLCDDQHNHDEVHKDGPQLGEVARLDTCVTVIDAAEFYNNLETMNEFGNGESQGTIAELMMEQVEFSNVVILNKTDLVNEEQQMDILDRISILNPKVKVLKSYQSKINVMAILNTKMYSKEDMTENSVIAEALKVKEATEKAEVVYDRNHLFGLGSNTETETGNWPKILTDTETNRNHKILNWKALHQGVCKKFSCHVKYRNIYSVYH